ncbi:class I SAM-dependent methyltransferase [Sporosarcina sp. ANT_H38]|uniref:class I SAM-dependent methyltransferase n=1 Tax=Sporosarcina sp. ANT_H38 TaxID=2597358 RepID=UPI0011F1EBCF|nr:class I SAM-dependent methyltransferase [Sporosarcina sp. ANT_H38]KAA0965685.1 class I SAM-dependent methyltransferase [Sporosarcina sp. ANT_H38]
MTEELAFNSKHTIAYEANARNSIPTYDMLFSMIQSYFRVQLGEKEASLLVVGAGGGNELSAWGPSNPKWAFTGVDPSKDMLQMAMHKSVQLGLEDRVKLIQGTVSDIPLTDSKFDAASCILVLHFIKDVQQKLELLRTIKDKLKPGAPFVLVTAYGDPAEAELQDRINVWKSFFFDVGYDASKLDEMGKMIMNISFIPEQQIEQLLQEAGFTNSTRFYSTGLFAGWICHAE